MATLDSTNAVPTDASVDANVWKTPAEKTLRELSDDLSLTRAAIDGAYELVNSAQSTEGDESLCHARALLGKCLSDLGNIWEKIDELSFAGPIPDRHLASVYSDVPTPLDKYESEICQRAGAIHSILVAGLVLIRKDDNDQPHKEIFQGCVAIEGAMALLEGLCGDVAGGAHARRRGEVPAKVLADA